MKKTYIKNLYHLPMKKKNMPELQDSKTKRK